MSLINFIRLILHTYADNWEEHGGYIVRQPPSLKPDYQLMVDLKKTKSDSLAASLHTATQHARWGFPPDRLEGITSHIRNPL
jgi:hypothetical protein